MLSRHRAAGLEDLVEVLAGLLAQPLEDPLATELVLVPTQGGVDWLRDRLARRLGASGGERGDGVVANVAFGFPGLVRQRVVAAGVDASPWAVEHVAWRVLEVLTSDPGAGALGTVARLPEGATWYGRSRRVADRFDRYQLRRPAMVRDWAAGRDVDGEGVALPEHLCWQPRLWRLVRERIGVPSPAEVEPQLLDALAAGGLRPELPPRLFLFGLTSPIAGLTPELLAALGQQLDVHLLVAEPSPGLARRARAAPGADGDDALADLHPLLASWARPALAAARVWAALPGDVEPEPPGPQRPAPSLLAALQADLRAGGPPAGDHRLLAGDRSVQVHACHGERRQVEVLRDALCHLLAADPTLTEEDVVVLCPRLEVFAPLVDAAFGAPGAHDGRDGTPGPPRLAHRIADRSLRDTYPTLAALGALVALVGGRFEASAVLDLLRLAPVRRRYDLDEGALATIAGWVGDTGVRWGLDADHRRQLAGLPDHEALTWRSVLDRLLVGVVASRDETALTPGGVLPVDVEGGAVGLAGRLADLLGRLAALAEAAARPRPLPEWTELFSEAARALLEAPPDEPWQATRLEATLRTLAQAAVEGGAAEVPLPLAEFSRALAEHLDGEPRRPGFFRGGITVTTLTPLRGIPHRVVAVLGLDEGALPGSAADGDDLVAAKPAPGDTDARSEGRQALLEAVLAARDHLVVTRTGHSVVTNQPVPPATPLAELRDALALTVHPDDRSRLPGLLEVDHPRQPFDQRNFLAGAVVPGLGPFSFDPLQLAGAEARAGGRPPRRPFLERPLDDDRPEVVELAELRRVLKDPVKAFLRDRLAVHLTSTEGSAVEDLPVDLSPLESWQLADDLLGVLAAGGDLERWRARQVAGGVLPAGHRGQQLLEGVEGKVLALLERARGLGYGAAPRLHPIDALHDGVRLLGAVEVHDGPEPGPFTVTYSKEKDTDRLTAWIDLVALTLADPEVPWRAVVVCPVAGNRKDPVSATELRLRGADGPSRRATAEAAASVLLDCHRRSRRAPFPLFARVSSTLAEGRSAAAAWDPHAFPGPRKATAVQIALGDLTLPELLAIPAGPDDPPGDADGRVERCAHHLWGAYRDSLAEAAEADA